MSSYTGYYVFGKKGLRVLLAPNITASVIDEKISLCKTRRDDDRRCIWEGDCEVTLNVEGQVVVINDHDEKNGKESVFVYQGVVYKVRGHIFQISDDDVVRMKYTISREVPGKPFTVRVPRGSQVTIDNAENIETIGSYEEGPCGEEGCDGFITYILRDKK